MAISRQPLSSSFHLPKTLRWVLKVFVVYVLLFTFFRLLTLWFFLPQDKPVRGLAAAFWLGFRFDLRWISLLLLPLITAGMIPPLSPYSSRSNRGAWTWYLALTTFFVVLLYAIDFGCFAYFQVRLGATVLNFADDALIATQMLWESYPLFWMLAGLLLLVALLRYLFHRLHRAVAAQPEKQAKGLHRRWFVLFLLLFSSLVYGGFPKPLYWNVAFRLQDNFSGYLSLNPLQSVFSTLDTRQPQFDRGKASAFYPELQRWMNWNPLANTYQRPVTAASSVFRQKPNVVLVLCESFSMYKSSMSGNPLNTTPYFQSLCDSGVFFNRCFSPHFSTARGLFALITGIPDVQLAKFSTRTAAVNDQHTIINDFAGYQRFYFLGGSPSFNNFEGLMKNVQGVQMITEGAFAAPAVDVWGISDKELFLEANRVFARQQQPFFAVVQTADNHPPYTVSGADQDFNLKKCPKDSLQHYGFESLAQYNALRYFDYSMETFMEAAKKEAYFENTLFVFIGDHGVAGNAKAVYPAAWTDNRLTEMHVPLLFYAPARLPAQKHPETVSQIDVLPTIAGLTGQPYVNSTLGRDLLHHYQNHSAFFIRHDEGEIGLVTDDFYFTKNIRFEKEKLLRLNQNAAYTKQQFDSVQHQLSTVASGFLETARWMLLHNGKGPQPLFLQPKK